LDAFLPGDDFPGEGDFLGEYLRGAD